VGANGTQTALHIDKNYLPFWLAQYHGRKQVRILLANDTAMNDYFDEAALNFELDVFNPKEPEWAQATVYETVLEPGQVLYIPYGAPHGARNLEDSIAISGNYLDKNTLPLHHNFCETNVDAKDTPKCDASSLRLYDAHPGRPPVSHLHYTTFRGYETIKKWCLYVLPAMKASAEQSEVGSKRHTKVTRWVTELTKYCKSSVPEWRL